MKKIILSIFVTSLTLSFAHSQIPIRKIDPKIHSFKSGLGGTFFHSEDIRGAMLYNEYNYRAHKLAAIAVGLSFAQGTDDKTLWKQSQAKALDFTGYFTPFGNALGTIRFGAGTSIRHVAEIYEEMRIPGNVLSPNEVISKYDRRASTGLGYSLVLEYEIYLGKFLVGARTSWQNYFNQSAVVFLGINGGLRF